MIRKNLLLAVLVVASLALFLSAGTSFAGVTAAPDSGGTGIVRGDVKLPNEVFVVANTGSTQFGGDAQQAPCMGGPAPEIRDMNVEFWTRTSGVVQVLYCGVLDNNSAMTNVDVRALVDSLPHTGNDIICQPSQIQWAQNTDDGGESSCFSWICGVENPKDCGRYGHSWCWTKHNVLWSALLIPQRILHNLTLGF